MSNNPKRQSDAKSPNITIDLSPQERNQLIAMAVRKLLTDAVLEAHNEIKHHSAN